jgi:hypothetical protein
MLISATFGLRARMSKHLTFIVIFVLLLGTIDNASAASTLRMTYSGSLTNTGADGWRGPCTET